MEQKFEHSALEQDIERLAAEIKERKVSGAEQQREHIKTSLGEQIQTILPSSGQASAGGAPSILPNYLQDAPVDIKYRVEKLLDLAWHKGVMAAASEARKNGPLILDAFHDAVTDKLYGELKKRGHLG